MIVIFKDSEVYLTNESGSIIYPLRLSERQNSLLYVCGLIEYLGRGTLNRRQDIVNYLGKKLDFIYAYADVYHCDPIERVYNEILNEINIPRGTYDTITNCYFRIPAEFEIGSVIMRLIDTVCKEDKLKPLTALRRVYADSIIDEITNFKSAAYFSQPAEILGRYRTGKW